MGAPPSTQWAAVMTWFSFIILPPQIWEPKFLNDICQGNSSKIGNKNLLPKLVGYGTLKNYVLVLPIRQWF